MARPKYYKKNYIEFAEILKQSYDNNWSYRDLVDAFATYFYSDNGNFQRQVFFNACGLEY